MTTLVMSAILIFGIMSLKLLPVSDMPNIDYPTITVSASLPGASPETMASSVATPLEKQFSTIAGIDSMTSTNAQGSTQITLTFSLNRSIDAAAQDVQAMISRAVRQLPREMPSPPSYQKVNPAASPVLMLALSSPVLPLSVVDNFAETFLAQRISMVDGVAQVQVYGAQKYAVRIQLDPRKLVNRGIGIDEVSRAIEEGNVNQPTGTLYGNKQAFVIDVNGQLTEAKLYRQLIVTYQNGSPVRLDDLGTILDDVENNKSAAWFKDARAVVLAVQRQPGTNTVKVVDGVMSLLPAFRKQIPASVNLDVVFDRSQSIRSSVAEVKFSLMLAIGLVILVIFLFLRNVRATIIPSFALPMSIIGTFAVMYLLHFSLDNLSLIALTLAVGFVVDDAIVMLENIVRHIEQGEKPFEAALNGSREIGFTIISMTLSLVAVFIPVLFMGGIVGRMLNEFAITIAVAILVSGVVSLSLTPMLSSRIIKSHEEEKHGALFKASEKVFQGALAFYKYTLRITIRHRFFTLLIFLATLFFTAYLFKIVPKGFISNEDLGQVMVQTEAAQGTSYKFMIEHQKVVAEIVMRNPNVAAFMSSAGGAGGAMAGGGAGNTGRLFIRLKSLKERQKNSKGKYLTAEEIVQMLRTELSVVPGIRAYPQNLSSLTFGGRMTKSQYQFTLQSPDTDDLYKYSGILEEKFKGLPGFLDVTTDMQLKNPQVNVDIDRDKASTLGVSVQQIENALYSAYGSSQISTIYAPDNDYSVIMELLPEYQMDLSALNMLYIRASSGELVPLSTVARVSNSFGPLSINHQGQLPSVTISFSIKPGTIALGDAVTMIDKISRETLPDTITTSFQGTAQAFASSMKGLGLLLIMAILVIYIVLGILYESFIHPITILSGLPSAGVGALLALKILNMQIDLYSFVGIIMLVGIVKKNAIMMIDFALDAQRKQGMKPAEAIYHGCLIRFRPIMMTTLSALMGTSPIAIGIGASAATRRPLGIAVVGGLILSQLLTLYITPVFYTYMESITNLMGKIFSRKKQVKSASESVPY